MNDHLTSEQASDSRPVHPRAPFVDQLKRLDGSAGTAGYAMPAEWSPLSAVWLVEPHNVETWPGCLDKAQRQFHAWAEALADHVEVVTTQRLGIATNDSWIRDFGPIFVKHRTTGELAAHDFHFNGWGGKYEKRELDDLVPQHIARHLDIGLYIHDMVLEGGSIEVNGRGTVMTTRQCLLNDNRNPHLSQQQVTDRLHEALGTRQVIWLPGGIVGDDTDGHVDDIARFVNPSTVVAVRAEPGHPDHAMLEQNWAALGKARDQDDRPLDVVPLPAPQPIHYDYPADRFGPGGRATVPASYANFLIANGALFVPTFGQTTDDQALRTLEQCMPNHQIVPIRAEWLVVGLGALHCLSMQQPA